VGNTDPLLGSYLHRKGDGGHDNETYRSCGEHVSHSTMSVQANALVNQLVTLLTTNGSIRAPSSGEWIVVGWKSFDSLLVRVANG
jgi:hypothetical protein